MNDKPPGTFSGEPIKSFREGWALLPFVGKRGHYWKDITESSRRKHPEEACRFTAILSSLCGVEGGTTERAPALNVGNWSLCKKCQAKAPRWARKEERATIWVNPKVRELFQK
jgi:hypothetical protein